MEDKRIGKSLEDLLKDSSLIQQVNILQSDKSIPTQEVPLHLIIPNPYQPRKTFDKTKLEELASSIKQYGVFTPILLRKIGEHYEIIAGERRYRASCIAGMKTIPAIIRQFDDKEMSEIAIIENIQRENLSPLEEADAYYEMQEKYNLTQEELSKKVGKSRSYIANILRLRTLPSKIKKDLVNGDITVGHARTLIGLEEHKALECYKIIKSRNLNVRETEELITAYKTNKELSVKNETKQKLSRKLNTRVSIGKNSIKIEYNSEEELREILEKLTKEN